MWYATNRDPPDRSGILLAALALSLPALAVHSLFWRLASLRTSFRRAVLLALGMVASVALLGTGVVGAFLMTVGDGDALALLWLAAAAAALARGLGIRIAATLALPGAPVAMGVFLVLPPVDPWVWHSLQPDLHALLWINLPVVGVLLLGVAAIDLVMRLRRERRGLPWWSLLAVSIASLAILGRPYRFPASWRASDVGRLHGARLGSGGILLVKASRRELASFYVDAAILRLRPGDSTIERLSRRPVPTGTAYRSRVPWVSADLGTVVSPELDSPWRTLRDGLRRLPDSFVSRKIDVRSGRVLGVGRWRAEQYHELENQWTRAARKARKDLESTIQSADIRLTGSEWARGLRNPHRYGSQILATLHQPPHGFPGALVEMAPDLRSGRVLAHVHDIQWLADSVVYATRGKGTARVVRFWPAEGRRRTLLALPEVGDPW